VSLVLPAADGEALAWLYRHGRVVERHDGDAGAVELSVRLDAQARGQFEQLFPALRLAAE
jgi:GTP-binding protein HflX